MRRGPARDDDELVGRERQRQRAQHGRVRRQHALRRAQRADAAAAGAGAGGAAAANAAAAADAKFASFFVRVLVLREERALSMREHTAYITFLVHAFQVRAGSGGRA